MSNSIRMIDVTTKIPSLTKNKKKRNTPDLPSVVNTKLLLLDEKDEFLPSFMILNPELARLLTQWRQTYPQFMLYWYRVIEWLTVYPIPTTSPCLLLLLDLSGEHMPSTQERLTIVPPLPKHCFRVNLSHNAIVDLNIGYNNHIKSMDLSYNKLTLEHHLTYGIYLKAIEILDLSHNEYESLPEFIIRASNLEWINVSANPLKQTPELISQEAQLVYTETPLYDLHCRSLNRTKMPVLWTIKDIKEALMNNPNQTTPVSILTFKIQEYHIEAALLEHRYYLEALNLKLESIAKDVQSHKKVCTRFRQDGQNKFQELTILTENLSQRIDNILELRHTHLLSTHSPSIFKEPSQTLHTSSRKEGEEEEEEKEEHKESVLEFMNAHEF